MARILIVDDDPLVLETIEDWLTFEKHSVTVANAGPAGWEYLQNNEYDLVVLDWDMPELTGIEILKRLREAGASLRIVMLTGHTSIDDKEIGLDSGADDYVTKPFHMKELCARVRALLRTQTAVVAPPQALGQGNEELLEHADLAGTRLAASYEFLELLGEGGTAKVFKARHPRLDKLLAVKVLLASDIKETAIARFEREARAVSHINHYNVVTVYDCGVTERNRPYIVMEYIEGESLVDKIDRDGPMPLSIASTILIQTCRGLQEAHSKGIIHRDLKPENIVLQNRSDREDWVKIVDFGLAHLLEGGKERLTTAGRIVGTPQFLSPERLKDRPPDARSDIYSLGVTLFEMLTARPLFDGESTEAIMIKVITTMPDPPSKYRQDIAPGSAFDKIFMKATERDPNLRYQSAAELGAELEQIQGQIAARRRTQQS